MLSLTESLRIGKGGGICTIMWHTAQELALAVVVGSLQIHDTSMLQNDCT